MNISFKYEDDIWEAFKKIAKQKYDLDATQAMKRLIDYVVTHNDIPDVKPILSSMPPKTEHDAHKTTDGHSTQKERKTGFMNARRHLMSGDNQDVRMFRGVSMPRKGERE